MKILLIISFVLIIHFISGCSHYSGINGKVVDNATGKPLEGALVVVQWTRPDIHSIEGFSTAVIMNMETLTDKEGRFVIRSTPLNPFANQPEMIIIKEGYIPWRNDEIFPGGNKDKDKKWMNNETYKLDVFTEKHTYDQIDSFLFLQSGGNEIPMFEALKNRLSSVQRQRANTFVPLDFKGKIVDAETNEPIEDAIIFASDRHNKSSHGTSDIDGNITITGNYQMLEYPPVIVVYKKGYIVKSSWDSLQRFKWQSGYVFQLRKCDIQTSWKFLESLIGQLDNNSNQFLRDKIEMEKSVK